MKTILLAVVILLALVGVLSIVLYVVNHKASVQIKETSLLPRENMTSLPRENIKSEGAAKFTHLTHGESNSLALIENQFLLGMTAGAFNPQFEPLFSPEQKILKSSEQQNPELQNMIAGDSSGSGIGFFGALFILLCLLIVF